MRDLPRSHTLCLMIIQGDLPGAHTILSDEYKRRVPHTNWYPEDMTNVGDLRGRKTWYIMLAVPGRFLENIGRFLENTGTHIFFRKGVPHTTGS